MKMLSKETINKILKFEEALIDKKVFRVTAHFWAEIISKQPKVQSGDLFNDLALSYSRNKDCQNLSKEQCKAFEESLFELLTSTAISTDEIDADILFVDYEPDERLQEAFINAGLPIKNIESYFPAKTVTWMKPGAVYVRQGYVNTIDEIYRDKQFDVQCECGHVDHFSKFINNKRFSGCKNCYDKYLEAKHERH